MESISLSKSKSLKSKELGVLLYSEWKTKLSQETQKVELQYSIQTQENKLVKIV
jgi:hypothetical protein